MYLEAMQFDSQRDSVGLVKTLSMSEAESALSENDADWVSRSVNALDAAVSAYVQRKRRMEPITCLPIGTKQIFRDGQSHTVTVYESYADAVARVEVELKREAYQTV